MNPVQEGPDRKADWVKAAFRCLHDKKSWCGRIHAHKLLVIGDLLGVINQPFKFTLYQYGPYSFDLDSEIARLEAFGVLDVQFTKPGYGPSYKVVPDDCGGDGEGFEGLKRVADKVGSWPSKQLELVSTCLWAAVKEGMHGDEEIVNRVLALKPRYSKQEVQKALESAKDLQRDLQSTEGSTHSL